MPGRADCVQGSGHWVTHWDGPAGVQYAVEMLSCLAGNY